MKLGVFGGAFDPVHYGHLVLAEHCRVQCALDHVCFVPAGVPPHRDPKRMAPCEARAEMLEFAVADNPSFSVERFELDRARTSYTVDTLEHIRVDRPGAELYLLMAADWIARLPAWRCPERILEIATVVAVNRGRPQLSLDLGDDPLRLNSVRAARFRLVPMPGMDLSATEIRRRVAAGESIRYLTSDPVIAFIRTRRLYTG